MPAEMGAANSVSSCSITSGRSSIQEQGQRRSDAELAIELGASECVSTEEGHEFLTGLDDFIAVRDALEAKLGAPTSAAFHLAGAEPGRRAKTRWPRIC